MKFAVLLWEYVWNWKSEEKLRNVVEGGLFRIVYGQICPQCIIIRICTVKKGSNIREVAIFQELKQTEIVDVNGPDVRSERA